MKNQTEKNRTDTRAQLIGTRLTREVRLEGTGEGRTIEIAFSSEQPVARWWGTEILDHEQTSVRLARFLDGAPLLLDHDPGRQIGVIESARIDADRVGRATVRFSRSAAGEEILQDVQDGIRTKISVGYAIHEVVLEQSDDSGDTYRITDWEPLEASLVSIPADTTVGVGRAHSLPETFMPTPQESREDLDGARIDPPQNGSLPDPDDAPEPDRAAATRAADPAEVNAQAEQIRAVGAHFGLRQLAEDQIMLGTTLAQFRDLVRTRQADPVPSVPRIEAHIPYRGNLRAFAPERYAGGRREAEQDAWRAGQWCRAVIFGDAEALRWCRDHQVLLASQTASGSVRTLTGLTGGQQVVVPDELVLPIISLRERYGLARQLCYVHPMSGETAHVPRDIADTEAYFVGREAAPDTSDPDFDAIELVAKNVAALTKISNDYADDSVINLAEFVAEKHARAFAVKEDTCLFNGDGSKTYGGIIGLRTALSGKAGAITAASSHDAFSSVDATDLRSVMAALPDYPGIDPAWLTSKVGQNLLFGRLTDAAGGNTKRDVAQKMPEQYAGYNIIPSPALPKSTGSQSGAAMILFGDLRLGVIFGDRRGLTMLVDPYSLSDQQQTKIISSERFDINCHGVGTDTEAGPVTALFGA